MGHNGKFRLVWAGMLGLLVLIVGGLLIFSVVLKGRGGLPISAQQPPAASVPAANFTLLDQDGHPVSMQSLRGKVVLLDFIYTNCPPDEACPVLTAKLVGLQRDLKAAGLADKVALLSITFDPERDTTEALKAYAERFKADLSNWHFLRGDEEKTREVAKNYAVFYQADSSGEFTHTSVIMVIDPQGNIRNWASPDFDSQDLLDAVREVL